MRFALEQHRVVLEGAAAVGIAALLSGGIKPAGPTVVVCSGGNAEQAQVEALAGQAPHPPG
jgi:threonine dehydratase